MDDVPLVGKLESCDQLSRIVFDELERQRVHRFYSVCHGAVGAVLKDEVQVFRILARAVKVNEVAVLRQRVRDVSLPHHRIHFALFPHLVLAQLLDGVLFLLALARHLANRPERTFAQVILLLKLRDLVVLHLTRHLVFLLR